MTLSWYAANLQDLEGTRALAHALLGITKFGNTISLDGALGTGKTTLTAMIAELLGSPIKASSPSYVLQNEYPLPARKILDHWDLYRISTLPLELLEPPEENSLRIIEWASKFPELAESCEVRVTLSLVTQSENMRHVQIGAELERADIQRFSELGLPLTSIPPVL